MTSTTSWSLAASSYHGLQFFGTGLLTAAHPWAGHWDTRNNHVGLVYVTSAGAGEGGVDIVLGEV